MCLSRGASMCWWCKHIMRVLCVLRRCEAWQTQWRDHIPKRAAKPFHFNVKSFHTPLLHQQSIYLGCGVGIIKTAFNWIGAIFSYHVPSNSTPKITCNLKTKALLEGWIDRKGKVNIGSDGIFSVIDLMLWTLLMALTWDDTAAAWTKRLYFMLLSDIKNLLLV